MLRYMRYRRGNAAHSVARSGFLLPRTQLKVVQLRTAAVMHKKEELSHIAGIETDVLCSMYAQVY
jgi:hypothetical protein